MLEGMGHPVVAVANGMLAIQALENAPFPVVIIDHQMPEMDGLTAIHIIRQAFPSDIQPFIIALTADARIETQQLLQEAGADIFLTKPISKQMLARAISRGSRSTGKLSLQSSAAPDKSAPWLDNQMLADLFSSLGADNVQAHQQILDLFLDSTPSLMQDIQAAAQASDLDRLVSGLHALKGSCELFGAIKLTQSCRQLEADVRRGQVGEINTKVGEVELLYNQLYSHFADMRAGKTPAPLHRQPQS
jgi:CheY-like chemotaxis protein